MTSQCSRRESLWEKRNKEGAGSGRGGHDGHGSIYSQLEKRGQHLEMALDLYLSRAGTCQKRAEKALNSITNESTGGNFLCQVAQAAINGATKKPIPNYWKFTCK